MTAPGLVPIAQAQGPDGGFRRIGKAVLGNIRTYCGVGGETYLWPRWIVLRAIGIVYILLFSGIIREGPALVGPRGIAPIARFIESIAAANPNPFVAFIRAPSLFWISSSPAMMLVVEWAGLGAAVALVLNLWPRLALGVCWSCCLSFVATWGRFSASAVDQVMLETALLAIPYAPAGRRPGLGADSPPRPIALFMMRWLLFRLMFENGIMKLATGDPYWRHFRVMDVLYETAPFPTILGYLDHHLPRAQHVLEMLLTYAAELPVPFLMIVAGRRWRWASLAIWTIFQAGIQLTMNFGWLNTASIALGILILDDQMLAAAASALGLRRLAALLPSGMPRQPPTEPVPWRIQGLRAALGLHFLLTIYFFATAWEDAVGGVPFVINRVPDYAWYFRSANCYFLFARTAPVRYEVEFQGSNDGGATWRTYEFRYQPQDPNRICPFIAPRYARFEATLQVAVFAAPKSPLFAAVAAELVSGNPDVIGLFRSNPFPGRPPGVVRMPVYQIFFTDLETHRRTGAFWRKEYQGEYVPPVYMDESGHLAGGG